jgi:hypothetical protein
MAKAALKKQTVFTSKLDLELRKCYIWSIASYGAETRSEVPGKF